MTKLLSSDDIDDATLAALLHRATDLRAGAQPRKSAKTSAFVFFEPSLRTRTGFLAAAQRLGWPAPIEVTERRSSNISMPESVGDTISVLAAYFDALVVRLDKPVRTVVPFVGDDVSLVNAGDRGPAGEHPTQSVIDIFAVNQLVGDLSNASIALCGDLRMRTARSLLKLLARNRPGGLTLVTDSSLTTGLDLPSGVGPYEMAESFDQLREIDALHAVGIPHLGATESVRTRLRVDAKALECLSSRGRVFCPMPVIDEIAQSVRSDYRMAYLDQSALALYVRMAVLEIL
jgi:aspartate carbamoyltransferase catalytic subunit